MQSSVLWQLSRSLLILEVVKELKLLMVKVEKLME